MAPFPDSFKAFMFQSGVDRIRDAYRASVVAMEHARREAQEAYIRYEESGEDDSEYDEDGVLTHSTRHALDQDKWETSLAVIVVREAFITSAFHYWEVSARAWTGLQRTGDNFPKLIKACAMLYSVDPQLEALNCLNNLLKHNNARRAQELAMLRDDHFLRTPYCSLPKRKDLDDGSWGLRITHEHVEEAFEIVRASGPTYDI